MRSREEVLAKFESMRGMRLSRRKEKFLKREHRNCAHNVRLRIKGNGKCGFCRNRMVMEKTGGEPFVCDEEGTARRCRFFECRNTPETVEEDFEQILSNPAKCGEEYPKLAIMIWFLQDDSRRSRGHRLKMVLEELLRSLGSLVFWRWW